MISRILIVTCLFYFNLVTYCQIERVDSLVKIFEPWRIDNTPCKIIRDSLFHKLKISPNNECLILGLKRKEVESILGKPNRKGWFYFEYKLINEEFCQNYSPPTVIRLGFTWRNLTSANIRIYN